LDLCSYHDGSLHIAPGSAGAGGDLVAAAGFWGGSICFGPSASVAVFPFVPEVLLNTMRLFTAARRGPDGACPICASMGDCVPGSRSHASARIVLTVGDLVVFVPLQVDVGYLVILVAPVVHRASLFAEQSDPGIVGTVAAALHEILKLVGRYMETRAPDVVVEIMSPPAGAEQTTGSPLLFHWHLRVSTRTDRLHAPFPSTTTPTALGTPTVAALQSPEDIAARLVELRHEGEERVSFNQWGRPIVARPTGVANAAEARERWTDATNAVVNKLRKVMI